MKGRRARRATARRFLTLVLLGDIFDLWQVIPAADKTQPSAAEIDLKLDPVADAGRAQRALDRRPGWPRP